MPRLQRDARFETREARKRIKVSKDPYWRRIHPGLFVGYYKGHRGGVWFMRRWENGKYQKERLGKADDFMDANGINILDYKQAHRKAMGQDDSYAKREVGIRTGPYLVRDAMADYLEWYAIHRKAVRSAELTINAHILPKFGNKRVDELTTLQIRKWHENLAFAPARTRGIKHRRTISPDDTEGMRKRKATANRILTVFKAALNHAWRDSFVASADAWLRVKPFRAVDAPSVRYLSVKECIRLINVCPPDFRQLVKSALYTGCRYGELARMKCNDYNPDVGTILINESKSGKPRHVPLTEEGQDFFKQATAGRFGEEYLFLRDDGQSWNKSGQTRPMRELCEKANISPVANFHHLRHTYGSLLAMNSVSLQVIAHALGHSDTRITERHYAHLMPNYVADTIRANLPSFGGIEKTNVLPFQ